jgi:hypothetical protein
MLVVLSPAKKLDWADVAHLSPSLPEFQDEANTLAGHARQLQVADLQKLMGISEALATLNRDRFKAFEPASTQENAKPAALAFAGDTYHGLEAGTLDDEAMLWAQDHLRILSGLYGVLRPLDRIQPYRLEMGSRLKTRRGATLYAFWGDRISNALNTQADVLGTNTLVNCASQEYFGAVDVKALKPRIITPVFLEEKAGKAKIVSFFAKKARGSMARFMIDQRINDPEGLKDFDTGGYTYRPDLSEGDRWVFLRAYPDA